MRVVFRPRRSVKCGKNDTRVTLFGWARLSRLAVVFPDDSLAGFGDAGMMLGTHCLALGYPAVFEQNQQIGAVNGSGISIRVNCDRFSR
jgi:hypothetical protein